MRYAQGMTNEGFDRERQLMEEIQAELPQFVEACGSDIDFVVMHQDAFARRLQSDHVLLLGKAIKCAGLMGKDWDSAFSPQP
jgi:hypothetical protein